MLPLGNPVRYHVVALYYLFIAYYVIDLSPLSDMSPATSDCLESYFSGGFYFIFKLSRVC